MFLRAGLRWASLGYPDRFAVDRLHDSFPAGKRFFEGEVDGCNEIIAVTLEDRMWFLCDIRVLAYIRVIR